MRELNAEEISTVNGGIIPIVVAIAFLDGVVYGVGAATAAYEIHKALNK